MYPGCYHKFSPVGLPVWALSRSNPGSMHFAGNPLISNFAVTFHLAIFYIWEVSEKALFPRCHQNPHFTPYIRQPSGDEGRRSPNGPEAPRSLRYPNYDDLLPPRPGPPQRRDQ